MRKSGGGKRGNEPMAMRAAPYLFVAPATAYFLCMSIIPMLMAFPISLTDWSALTPDRKFVGFDNYIKLFGDEKFWSACLAAICQGLFSD